MNKGIYKKLTFENRFDRKYRCNTSRFVSDMKQRNRKELRRRLKVMMSKEFETIEKLRDGFGFGTEEKDYMTENQYEQFFLILNLEKAKLEQKLEDL